MININYKDTLKIQQDLREKIAINQSDDSLIIVEHDHVYTLGKNANPNNILNDNCSVVQTDRGGDVTYHGPGQLICYFAIDLNSQPCICKFFKKRVYKFIFTNFFY